MNLDPAIVFFTLGSSLVLFLGILLAFSPRRFVRFGEWCGSLIGLKPSNIEWKQSPALNWRLSGVYLICIGLFFLTFLAKNFYIHPNPPDAEGVRLSTGELLGVTFSISFGTYLVLRTNKITQRMMQRAPFRTPAGFESPALKLLFKAVGLILVFGGLTDLVRLLLAAPR
jgi:hypothetical protein